MRRVQIIGALCLAVVIFLLSAVNANAAPGDPFQYQYSFNGAGVPGGIGNPEALAVNHATGNVLVYQHGELDQFDSEGNPVDFSSLGSPKLPVGREGLTLLIDNTGGATQGNIYFYAPQEESGFGSKFFWAYAPDGSPLGAENPIFTESTMNGLLQVVGVNPDGTLETIYLDYASFALASKKMTPLGQPIGLSEPFFSQSGGNLNGGMIPSAFDELGNLYAPIPGGVGKYSAASHYAYEGATGLPNGLATSAFDPSTNDVYVRQGPKVLGIHYSDPLVESTPFEALDGISSGGPIAFDATGEILFVSEGNQITVFKRGPNSAPFAIDAPGVDQVRSSEANLHGHFAAGGAEASYHFEYGTTTSYGTNTPQTQVPLGYFPVDVGTRLAGLQPDTTYHARLVASNSIGTTYGPDKVFKTYGISAGGANDTCPNALARKQTVAQRLPDCRAYELVSASNTGGYDVESYLAPGQNPFPGFPLATDKLLYATHSGAVPGPWNATNKGPDPYIATRTANGWVTNYEGLPSDLNPAAGSFSSVLGEADSQLSTLAFAGPNLCSPCFTGGGLETGLPVRLPSGELVQGMAGSLSGTVPASARPEGRVAKYFSGEGKDLLFASKYAFEPGANDENGSLTVYERDLGARSTEIVSTDEAGNVLTGEGISELDVSTDGSRVVVAKKVSEDPQGNEYVRPYLHIAGRKGSIDLAPGTTSGVLFAGMTEDGSKAFFTTTDKLLGSDTDSSADLYEADVDGSGNLDLKLLTAGNSNACSPVANEAGEHWNTTGAMADCSAVAIAGGGGITSSTGAAYFLSPESFGGEGTLNQPNLYLAQPNGQVSLAATLEPNNPLVLDSVKASATRRTGDFQTTPSGNYAVFTSALPLTGVGNFGFRSVFEFSASGGLTCPSCDATGSSDGTLANDAELAPKGLSLLGDGRVFFTTRFPLTLNDANGRNDVYEWSNGEQQLISNGTGPFDSGLLTVSADGTDAFFFTHDNLAPEEDHNGQQMKIYDAREGGGFFKLPASVPCQASDECHGPGTPAPGPPDIKSSGKTTHGNVLVCPKNRVKKRGQCVKKAHAKKKHRKKHAKKKGAAKKRAAGTNGKRGGRNA